MQSLLLEQTDKESANAAKGLKGATTALDIGSGRQCRDGDAGETRGIRGNRSGRQ